jgi:MBG domain-containing protein
MRRRLLWCGLFGILGLVGVLGVVSSSSAGTPHGWRDAVQLPGIAALNTDGFAPVSSVSCPAPGECAVGGYYTDGAGSYQPFVADETNASWGNAIELPGIAALDSGSYSVLSSLSCGAVGDCAAGGYYVDYSPDFGYSYHAFVANETNGSWSDAVEVPGTSGFNAQVTSVSCGAAGDCAVGGYDLGAAFVASETNGTWADAVYVTLPSSNGASGVSSVSCNAAGECAAGGYFYDGDSHRQLFLASETSGSWGDAVEVPGIPALNTGYVSLNSVSCAAAGDCALGGTYTDGSSHQQAFVASETSGSLADAVEVPGTAALNSNGYATVNSVSCGAVGDCAAGGYYYDDSGTHAFVASETSGSWGDAVEVPGIAALEDGGYSSLNSVSCGAAGDCAVGGYYSGDSGQQAFLARETSGSWDDAVQMPGVAGIDNGGAAVSSISCGATGDCAAGGYYFDGSGNQAFVVRSKADQVIDFAALSGHTYGDANFDPGATASSGDAVSYGASGACSIVGGKVHLTGAGSCQVTASAAGDGNFNAAPSVQRSFSVGKAALSITAGNRSKYVDQALTLGTKVFTSSGLVGSDSVAGVTLTSSGAAATAASGNYPIVPSSAVSGPGTNLAGNYMVTFHNATLHVSPFGIVGLNGVSVSTAGGSIDSFDSSHGAYGSSNHGRTAVVLSNGPLSFAGVVLLGGAISTHGSVSVASTAGVSGAVTAGTTATVDGLVGGTVTQHSPSAALSVPTVAACAPFSPKTGISGGSFTYASGNLTVTSATVKLANGTYCFHNVTLGSGAKLSVSGPVRIRLTGTLTGAGLLVNTTNRPEKLQIESSFAGSNGVVIAGGNQAYMTMLAPRTSVAISGGSFFGKLLAKTVSLTGGVAFHADTH